MNEERVGYGLAAASGIASGCWMAWLIPRLALMRGCPGGSPLALLPALAVGGGVIALLLLRLLYWARTDGIPVPRRAVLLPWLAAILPALAWSLPESYYAQNITTFGPMRYLLNASWLLGTAIYSFFLITLLSKSPTPMRMAAGWIVVATLVSFPVSVQPPSESDECDYVVAALSLLDEGTMQVATAVENGAVDEYYYGKMPPNWAYYKQELQRDRASVSSLSYRMAGYPIMLTPFIALGRRLNEPAARWWVTYVPGLIAYGLLVLALARLLAPRGQAGLTTLAVFATMTPFLYYPTNTQPEMEMAASMAWTLLFLREHLEGRRGPAAFAAVAALSMLCHERMAVLAISLLIFGFWRSPQRGRLAIVVAICAIPVAVSYASTLQFHWPTHLPHAYGQDSIRTFDPARWLEAFRQHLVSLRIGLITHIPPLLFLFGWILQGTGRAADRAERDVNLGALVASALYAALIITYPHTFDSWPHVRYMIPLLPLLAPAVAEGIERIQARTWGTGIIATLIVIQLLLDWVFLSIPPLWRVISL